MRGKIMSSLLASAFVALLGVNAAIAAEDHKAEALKQAVEAVESGKKGDAAGIGEHATAAKTHAEAADKEKTTAHLKEAIKSLNSAIEQSKSGKADVASKAAAEAVTHLMEE
ncbi:MAG: hypothetical protein A2V90_01185 [Gammaproteobacteria bacterium RBG_16_57_12]|nr:MAG: hypothetical protein A2V90_01185 [Gammaproteobacteria bacterium RBG_16_57_12]